MKYEKLVPPRSYKPQELSYSPGFDEEPEEESDDYDEGPLIRTDGSIVEPDDMEPYGMDYHRAVARHITDKAKAAGRDLTETECEAVEHHTRQSNSDLPLADAEHSGRFWSGIHYSTPEAKRIGRSLAPEWMEQFLTKNSGYGTGASDLGPTGEFVEVWRKAKKLKRGLWEGQPIGNEGIREVAMDMIGHLFLLIDHLDRIDDDV